MNVIITGSTGLIGEGLLLECIKSKKIAKILSVTRRPTNKSDPKLEEYIVPDFLKLEPNDPKLQNYDACFYCATGSSVGLSNEEYKKMTLETPLHFAKAIGYDSNNNKGLTFVYVSGEGATQKMDSWTNWKNIKGQAEIEFSKVPFKKCFALRPCFVKPIPEQKNINTITKIFSPIGFALKWTSLYNTTSDIGKAMIQLAQNGYEKYVVESKDIQILSKKEDEENK